MKREKHTRVPMGHTEDGFKLGMWISRQRSSYKANSLSLARIRALESVKGWIWDILEANWQEGFDYLKRFLRREKHARVPQRHIEDGFKLGVWVNSQRSSYKAKSLELDRIRALESVKGWVWGSLEADWQEGFDHLMRFVKREKHARVPFLHIEDGFRLPMTADKTELDILEAARKQELPEIVIKIIEAVDER